MAAVNTSDSDTDNHFGMKGISKGRLVELEHSFTILGVDSDCIHGILPTSKISTLVGENQRTRKGFCELRS
ncbi:hypothetical protein ACFX13_000401 [Malus domestica]